MTRLPAPLLAVLALAACSTAPSGPRYESGLEGLDLTAIGPDLILPGTTVVVAGRSFVDAPFGDTALVLRGSFDDGGGDREVEVRVPLRFVDFERMEAEIGEGVFAQLRARTGDFHGDATIEVESKVDGLTHASRTIGVTLGLRTTLTPALATIPAEDVLFVNDRIALTGDGLLLGGAEGTTYAVVEGCVAAADGPCAPTEPVRVPITPDDPLRRGAGSFPFVPAIAGIRAGRFSGQVRLENQHGGGAVTASGTAGVDYEVVEATISGAGPGAVSLGQYLTVEGGGFVGGAPREVTLLQLLGTFTPADGGAAIAIDTTLVPEFVDGHGVRYAVNEDDHLGRTLDPRGLGGVFAGTIAPRVSYRDQDVTGAAFPLELELAPLKQVVFLNFTSPYVTSLQAFGLRALDAEIRARIARVVARDYATINLDVRTERPTDFAVYAEVEIDGPDPNGLALLGYDNTPGKDVGNVRLHDRIGGVNAVTQADGYPGFGGVFVESLFVFSEHPGEFVSASAGADPAFDHVFDPFRPDRDGDPVRAADLGGDLDLAREDATGCPATSRADQIECAVFVLGSLIGTTVSHELGHSLGLANPEGTDPHLVGDRPGRLMESGGARPFAERAELGVEPGRFCADEYDYLRKILPSDAAPDDDARPSCR
jgi:hypothetical protein